MDPIALRKKFAALGAGIKPLPVAQAAPVAAASPRPLADALIAAKQAALKETFGQDTDVTDYRTYAEIKRITSLRVVREMEPEELEEYCRVNILADAFTNPAYGREPGKGFRFLSKQAEGGWAYDMIGGLLASIGVGFGKTLLSLHIANKAYNKGIGKMLLCVPPQAIVQFVKKDIQWARMRIPIAYPIHILGGRDAEARKSIAKSGKKGLYVMTYSQMSGTDAFDLLCAIAPGICICDEAQNLARYEAARTRRFKAYVDGAKPELVAMSGTLTQKSIKDYHPLAVWSLGSNCPLPISTSLMEEWAQIIDAAAIDYREGGERSVGGTGPLMPLVTWAQKHFPDEVGGFSEDIAGFRRAFKMREQSAPGVVSSGDMTIGTSLYLCNQPVEGAEKEEGYAKVKKLMEDVSERWVTPNGDEIDYAIHCYKWLYELSAGFYNQLTWPTADKYAERHKITLDAATDLLARSKEHHRAGQEYAKALRTWIKEESYPGLDTPMLIGGDMARNKGKNVGDDLFNLWLDHKSLDFEGRPDRDSTVVRVCDYKIKAAIQWAYENWTKNDTGCLLWFYNNEVGDWLIEMARQTDMPVMYAPAGKASDASLIEEKAARHATVTSISAHHAIKNLQHYQHQYVVQWPRPAAIAEQMLGRTHRTGQKADELYVVMNHTNLFDKMVFAACLNDSLYIHQTKNWQKLIYANYDPLPAIFPPQVLNERGLQITMLNAEQRRLFEERFGE